MYFIFVKDDGFANEKAELLIGNKAAKEARCYDYWSRVDILYNKQCLYCIWNFFKLSDNGLVIG